MPEITFSCPRCGRNYQVRSLLAGKKVRCKDCKEISRISDPQAPAPSHLEPSVVLIACPQCGHDFRVSSGLAGKRARCKRCGEVFHIPSETKQQRPLARPNVEEAIGNEPEYALLEKSPALPVGARSRSATGIDRGRNNSAGSSTTDVSPHGAASKGAKATDRREPSSSGQKSGRSMLARIAALGVVLVLAGGALYGLFSRPWTAATDLFGISSGEPDEPFLQADLQVPDVAPDRLALVRQHAQVLEELGQAYNEMAGGYAAMRSAGTFQMGQRQVTHASDRLDELGKKGQALPKLETSEKKALSYIGNGRVVASLARAVQEVGRLKETPGIKGDFGRLEKSMTQSLKGTQQEFPLNLSQPAVELVISQVGDPSYCEIIQQKVASLTDDSTHATTNLGFSGGTFRLKLTPVSSTRACAARVNFGKVIRINGRRIEIKADPPSALELARLGDRRQAKEAQTTQGNGPARAPAREPDGPSSNKGPDTSKPAEISLDTSETRTGLSDRPKPDGNEKERFHEIAPERGLLVGAQVGYINIFGGAKVGAVRPIFQVGDAYVPGQHHGKDIPTPLEVVARPGYAVGAINTRTGLLLDAFQFVFMRFQDGKLDPSDSYASSWLGDPRGGGSGAASGAGKLIVGLHGRTNGREINSLGLVVQE